jgi:hypothetical protein
MYEDEQGADPATTEPMDGGAAVEAPRVVDEAERKLSAKIVSRIKADRKHWEKPFKQMREDMKIARTGRGKDWPEKFYTANITGRHINQKVAALYAKNPKAIARRRERLDFKVWDETVETLTMAMETVAMAPPPMVDPLTGMAGPQDPLVMKAMDVVADFEQGMTRRQQVEKIGKTLEILFEYFTGEQTPVDFKTSMKQLVRRAATAGVGYLKLGFQREFDKDPTVQQRLADFQQQLLYIQNLAKEAMDPTDEQRMVKEREVRLAMESLSGQENVLIREGLVFDFPDSTRVLPDKMCRVLTGFIGARWVTVEYLYTPEEVKRNFGVDLGKDYTCYSDDGTYRENGPYELEFGEENPENPNMCCVWEHYDRQAGLVYIVCDGYKGFLKQPGKPDVYVEDFWPIYALTFNEVEDPSALFPPSDVRLMMHMQDEYNRAGQGKREHRQAARPRFATPKGALDDETKAAFATAEPFSVTEFNPMGEDPDIRKLIQPIQIPGVDPNLYETGTIMQDLTLVVGSSEAQFGGVSKATATESSIAEGSRVASVDSNVDDLDSFLTRVARAAGQVLLREMSPETVIEIAGEGAMWPQMTLEEIAKEVYLEIEAGSSGKPNQAQEIRNWREMLPFILQMPGINPTWLLRETLRRLDDRMDLTAAITEGLPAIVAANRMTQPAPGDASADPEAQGDEGGNNGPAPPGGPTGSDPAMGNNQQAVM